MGRFAEPVKSCAASIGVGLEAPDEGDEGMGMRPWFIPRDDN